MPRRLTAHDLSRFLTHLSQTGNFALAAARAGHGKSGLYKRRAASPAFASKCEAALTLFRANALAPSPSRGEGWREGREAKPSDFKTTPGALRLYTHRTRPPQLRRAQPGHLTPAGVAAFLRALSASANIRLSAQSVGVAASSVHARRRRDPRFAEAWDHALQIGTDRLEMALIDQACATLEPADAPVPQWENQGLDPFAEHTSALPELVIAPMAVNDALRLLRHHREHKRRKQKYRPAPTLEDLRASILRKVMAIRRAEDDARAPALSL